MYNYTYLGKLEFFDLCGNLNINDIHIKQCVNVFKHLKYLNLVYLK